MKIPQNIPEKGFYYHYKHTPDMEIGDYTYELIGVGIHTEDNCRPEDENLVVYRPLYESSVFKAGKFFDIRPFDDWTGEVVKDGKTIKRFEKINNPELIAKLKIIRDKMYL